jgi:hypothetical protein
MPAISNGKKTDGAEDMEFTGGLGSEEERFTAEAQRAQRRWRRPDKAGAGIEIWKRSGMASDAGHVEV